MDHLKNELAMVKEELGTKAQKDKTKVEVSAQTESTESRLEDEVTLGRYHQDKQQSLSL